jgi:hypothetical protein
MQTLRVIYTKRRWNPVSWLIRYMLPMSRMKLARSSHAMVVDGEHIIEAHMIYGVRRVPHDVALAGAIIVKDVHYAVPDAEAGLAWFRSQVCTYEPILPDWLPAWLRKAVEIVLRVWHNNYDFKGAIGVAIAPDRDWQNPVSWFCYEAIARMLKAAGLDVFADTGYVTELTLLTINPQMNTGGSYSMSP